MEGIIESAKYVVLGNVDAGKSTFIGVMEFDQLDDGKGHSRSLTTKIKHELESHRTSTHSMHYIIKQNEITTLIDLCGHEAYLKTTLFGLMGLFPDYGLFVVGANMGLSGMAVEHFGLLISNKIPFITLITKVDICPKNILLETMKDLTKRAKTNKKELLVIENEESANKQMIVELLQSRNIDIMPVIMISNKTGKNIKFTKDLLTSTHSPIYLSKVNGNNTIDNEPTKSAILFIDNTFNITGIGIVLSGTLKYGSLSLGQTIYIGPLNGSYITATIRSIHNCIKQDITVLEKDNSGSIGIRLESKGSYTRDMFSKGQIAATDLNFVISNTCYTFETKVAIFNHPTTIKNNYQTIIHCRTIRQAGKFRLPDDVILRSNSRSTLTISFVTKPEFILPDTYFMFQDGHTKGMGKIIKTIPYINDKRETQSEIKRRKLNNRKKPIK